MPNKEYWEKRFIQLEEAQRNKGIEYCKELEKQYKKAESEVEKQITIWYARFASNNEISMSEAKKLLNSEELAELKWSVEDYIKAGRENNVDGSWAKELENASAKVHINRLESLKLQMRQQVEVLYAKENSSFRETMQNIYEDSYYQTAFEIQRGLGKGFTLMQLDENKINKVLSKPWAADESNFSGRIWKQRSKLVTELTNHLSQILIRGVTPDDAIKDISKRFQVSIKQAKRLVMTELAFVHSAAQKDLFDEFGVERYQILATLDKRTSEICRSLDHKVIDMKDYRVGVTAPPFHPNCRTTTMPYFDDEFTEDEMRAARDEKTGKTYYVPANMSYKEWHAKYVMTPVEDLIANLVANGKIVISDHAIERVAEREVDRSNIMDAIREPLHIGDVIISNKGQRSVKYIGREVTVALNPDTGVIATIWKTGSRVRKKYEKSGD